MHVILIYCRPGGETPTEALGPWLEQQAAELSAQQDVRRTTVVGLTAGASDRRDRGWLLECELEDDAGPPGDILRDLLTDMRLVGLHPVVCAGQGRLHSPRAASRAHYP
jgi:hypothetical protein